MVKILHIASENFAGVPFSLVKAERLIGLDSQIISFIGPGRGHPIENVLNMPFAKGFFPKLFRRITQSSDKFGNTRYKGQQRPLVWNPSEFGFQTNGRCCPL